MVRPPSTAWAHVGAPVCTGVPHRPVGALLLTVCLTPASLHHCTEQAPTEKKGVYKKFAHTEGRSALKFTPDGKCARPSRHAQRRLRAAQATQRTQRTRKPSTTHVAACCRQILTGGADGRLKIFDAGNLEAEPAAFDHAPLGEDAGALGINTLAFNHKVPPLPVTTPKPTSAVMMP
jgi:hypothetical protein